MSYPEEGSVCAATWQTPYSYKRMSPLFWFWNPVYGIYFEYYDSGDRPIRVVGSHKDAESYVSALNGSFNLGYLDHVKEIEMKRHGTNPDAPAGPKPTPPANPPSRGCVLVESVTIRRDFYDELVKFRREGETKIAALEQQIEELKQQALADAAEVQALVERLRRVVGVMPGSADRRTVLLLLDELAKLARDYAPEVSQKPPSPRGTP